MSNCSWQKGHAEYIGSLGASVVPPNNFSNPLS